MRHGLTREAAQRRFEFEAQVLGRLHHPGIAQVFEAGVFDDRGRSVPYFVMEYVAGARTLTAHAEHERLGVRPRLELLARVCEAVACGHQQGVVHCDLKPENVLVPPDGRPKVIDFGIARAADRDPKLTTVQTGVYSVAGTLPYMSPEQAGGDLRAIDIRTDVYALGALGYELLAGRLPLELAGGSIADAMRRIASEEPAPLGTVDPRLRGDVETIVRKALEKEPGRRYASAAELAADVRRFLRDEPILARRPTTFYQLRKFARRHRGLVAGAALAVASMIAGTAVAVQQAVVAKQREASSRWEAYRASIAAAASALASHDVALARATLDAAPERHREWEWRHLRARLDDSVATAGLPGGGVPGRPWFGVAGGGAVVRVLRGGALSTFDPLDARLVDSGAADHYACDPASGVEATVAGGALAIRGGGRDRRLDLAALGVADVDGVGLSPGGAFAVVVEPARATRIDLGTGAAAAAAIDLGRTGITAFDVAADGTVAFAAGAGGWPALWPPGAAAVTALAGVSSRARAAAFDAPGRRLALGLQDATVGIWDLDRGARQATWHGHRHAVTAIAFAPGGGHVVSASLDRTLRVWSTEEDQPVTVLQGHERGVRHVAVAADGARIASTAEDGTLRIWDGTQRHATGALAGHARFVFPVAFAPDGSLLASAGTDGTIRLWDPATYAAIATLPVPFATATALAFDAGTRRLVAAGDGGYLAFDLAAGRRLAAPAPAPEGTVRDLAFLAGGERVLLPWHEAGARVRVWNTTTGAAETVPLAALAGESTRFLAPGGRFAVLYRKDDRTGDVRAADADSGAELVVLEVATGRTVDLPPLSGAFAFHPGADHELCARLAADPTRAALFDVAAGTQVGELAGHSDRIYAIAYAPGGSRIATAGRDGVRLWSSGESPSQRDGRRGHGVVELRGHTSFVWSVAWSPDGSQLATGSGDRTARLWDTRPIAAVHALRGGVGDAARARAERLRAFEWR